MNEWEDRKEGEALHDQPSGIDSPAAPYAATVDARSRYEQAEPKEPARIGPLGRLIGTLFSPGETFQDINRKPTILAPLLIMLVILIAAGAFFEWWVKPNWEQMFRGMITKSMAQRGQSMSEEEINQTVRFQVMLVKTDFTSPVGILIAILRPLIFYWFVYCLIPAAIFALALMLLDAKTTFKKIFSVISWSTAATTVVYMIVLSAALMIQDRESLRDMNPANQSGVLPTSLGSFLPSDMPQFIRSIAASFELFAIWTLILFCIGFAAISRSRRMTAGKAAIAVFGLWFIWVLVKAAGSMILPGA